MIQFEGLTENPHPVWTIIEPSGLVVSGHCTCMTSSDVVCSHVAATLFALDACKLLFSQQCLLYIYGSEYLHTVFWSFFFFKVCAYSRRSHPLPFQTLRVAGGVSNLCMMSTFHTQIRGERCISVSFKESEKWLVMWCDIRTWCVSFQTIDENSRQSTPVVPPATAEEIKQFYDSLASSGHLLWTHNKFGHIFLFLQS